MFKFGQRLLQGNRGKCISRTAMGLAGFGYASLMTSTCEAQRTLAHDDSQVYVSPSATAPFKIFAGSTSKELAQEVAGMLNVQLGRAKVGQFADGECQIRIYDSVRGTDTYIIANIDNNDSLMELLLLISTLRRASAKRVVAVIPYFGYVRQLADSNVGSSPIACKTIANLLEVSGVDQVIAVELHRPQAQGFFPHIPIEVLTTTKSAVPYFMTKRLIDPVVLTTSNTSQARAKAFRDELISNGVDGSMAFMYASNEEGFVDSDQDHHGRLEDEIRIVGEVQGRDAIIVDDMIDSGSRVTKAVQALEREGARRIFAFATHAIFSSDAIEKLSQTDVTEVVVFNTRPISPEKWNPIIRQLSCGGLIASAISIVHNKRSLLDLEKTTQ